MTPTDLNQRLLSQAEALLRVWLPEGQLVKGQWVSGAWVVNPVSGRWWDWGDPPRSGDTLTGLYAAITGREYAEAAAEVAEDIQPVMAPAPVMLPEPEPVPPVTLTLVRGGAQPAIEPLATDDPTLYPVGHPTTARGRPPKVASLEERRILCTIEDAYNAIIHSGKPVINERNIQIVLRMHPDFSGKVWMNDFSETPHMGDRAMTDFDFSDVMIKLQDKLPKLRLNTVTTAMVHMSKATRRDPIKEWLDGLKWDGIEREERLLAEICGATDCDLSCHASRHIMRSMVARQYLPGTKVDELIILEGKQGIGKSQFVERLAGGHYSNGGDAKFGTNDYIRLMRGVLIMEIGELAAMRKTEIESVKQFITTQADHYVDKYDKLKTVWARRCIFIGTTNDSTYLQDTTGNRRFIPIQCNGRIDLGKLAIWRDQLFAESVAKYKRDPNNWYRPFNKDAQEAQDARVIVDPWQERIEAWAASRHEPTSAEIWGECLGEPLSRLGKQEAGRIQHCMRMAGYESVQVRRGQGRVSVWRKRGV